MKTYVKILALTLLIQIFGLSLAWLTNGLFKTSGINAGVFSGIILGTFILSIGTDICLALRWGISRKEKLILILLMPTNYTWILMGIAVILLFRQIIDLLQHFPKTLG